MGDRHGADDPGRRRPHPRLRRRGSRQRRGHRPARRLRREPLGGAGDRAASCRPAFRPRRRRRRARPETASRPRPQRDGRRRSTRDRLPRHRGVALLRPRAGGQRGRRALHPHPRGATPVGARVRHARATTASAPHLHGPVPPGLAAATPRPSNTRPGPSRPASRGHGRNAAGCGSPTIPRGVQLP